MREVHKDNRLHVLEYEPKARNVRVKEYSVARGYSHTRRYVALPYHQFTAHKGILYLTFSNGPIQSIRDQVYFPTLPNIFSNGACCLQFNLWDKIPPIEELIENFWSTEFGVTGDGGGLQLMANSKLRNWSHWETLTREDPSFITGVNWPRLAGPIESIPRTHRANLGPHYVGYAV